MIEISLIQGSPYIWKCQDVADLREKYRIVGALVGCLPRCPFQNAQLGLPLKLLNEEAALLLNKGIGRLVDDSKLPELPTPKDVEDFNAKRRSLYEQQVAVCKEQRTEELNRCRKQILEGKLSKQRKVKEARQAAGEDIGEQKSLEELTQEVESLEVPTLPSSAALIQLCTAGTRNDPQECDGQTWPYPNTSEERLRCRIFRDLWEKGYHLTSGAKFGGDFLVYPGDPLAYHSFYIAVCLPFHQRLTSRRLVALGRLGSTVKKTVLLCSVNESDDLVYTSLEWTHIS